MAVGDVPSPAPSQCHPRPPRDRPPPPYAERRAELMRRIGPSGRAAAGFAARAAAQRRHPLQVPAGQRHPVPDRVRGAGGGGGAAARAREDARSSCSCARAIPARGDLDGPARRGRGRRARLRRRRGVHRRGAGRQAGRHRWRAPRRSTTRSGASPTLDAAVARLLGRLRVAERRGTRAPLRLVDARLSLHEMRLHQVARRGRGPAPRRRDHRARRTSPRCAPPAPPPASTRSRR